MTGTDRLPTARRSATCRSSPAAPWSSSWPASNLRIRGTDGDRWSSAPATASRSTTRCAIEAAPGRVRIRDGEGCVPPRPARTCVPRRAPDLDIDLPAAARSSLRTLSGRRRGDGDRRRQPLDDGLGRPAARHRRGPVASRRCPATPWSRRRSRWRLTARTVSGRPPRPRAPARGARRSAPRAATFTWEADLAAGGRHAISVGLGDVDLATGEPRARGDPARSPATSGANGPHRTEGGRGRRTLIVGNGSVVLSVRTTSGDVRVGHGGLVSARRAGAAGRRSPPVAPGSVRPMAPSRPSPARSPEPPPRPIRTSPRPGSLPAIDRREAARLERPPSPRARRAGHRGRIPPPGDPRGRRAALLPGVVLMAAVRSSQVLQPGRRGSPDGRGGGPDPRRARRRRTPSGAGARAAGRPGAGRRRAASPGARVQPAAIVRPRGAAPRSASRSARPAARSSNCASHRR